MNDDIAHILSDWEYDPERVNARKILGRDGREKVQMRVDLGVIQMEVDGRPDGRRPHGKESLLDHELARLETYRRRTGKSEGFALSSGDCRALREEGTQYYLRYLSLFHCGDYGAVVRDTARNLKLFDFVHAYAEEEDDRVMLEQYRPYVLMMNCRARALMALERSEYRRAQRAVDDGMARIREVLSKWGIDEDGCRELRVLDELAESIRQQRPPTEEDLLRDELREALEREDYERAAQIRDVLRGMEAIV